MIFVSVIVILFLSTLEVNSCCCGCCGCCGCCCGCPPIPNTIATTVAPTTTTTDADTSSSATARSIHRLKTKNPPTRMLMRDYLKITDILHGQPRARRYNYDLSEVMNADDDSRIDKQELGLEQDLGLRRVKGSTAKLSVIGAVNPMQLPGALFVPAPHRNLPAARPESAEQKLSWPN